MSFGFDVDPRDRMIAALKGQIATYREQSVLDAITLGDKDAEIERQHDNYSILKRDYDALREQIAALQASSGYEASIAQLQIERLRAALQSLTHDPPASLAREPDTDCEVILKMREIARRALEPKPTEEPKL